jgi:hypothetical protein
MKDLVEHDEYYKSISSILYPKLTVQAWPDTVKLDSITAICIDFGLFVLNILLLLVVVAPGIMNGIKSRIRKEEEEREEKKIWLHFIYNFFLTRYHKL